MTGERMLTDNEYHRISDQRIVTEFSECPIDNSQFLWIFAKKLRISSPDYDIEFSSTRNFK